MKFTKEERMQYIGSSDIAAVLGMSRWSTPLKVWAEKTGQLDPEDLSNNEAVEWGSRLEEVVAQKFADKNSVKLIAYKKRYVHDKHEFLTCELDRLITGTDELVEVKTASAYKLNEWSEGDDIPIEYILQVMFALGLSKRKVGHVAVLIGGNKYIQKKILFDQKMFDDMVSKAVYFWEECVKKKIPPMAEGQDNKFMVDLYPKNKLPELIQANTEVNDMIALRQETCMHIDEMIKEKDELEAKIKQIIGDNEGLITEKYKVTWKTQNGPAKILSDKMKEDLIFEKYSEPTTRRVLRVSKIKESKDE